MLLVLTLITTLEHITEKISFEKVSIGNFYKKNCICK